jgi:hypothetical protein
MIAIAFVWFTQFLDPLFLHPLSVVTWVGCYRSRLSLYSVTLQIDTQNAFPDTILPKNPL